MTSCSEEEKKDDGILLWESGLSGVKLPTFASQPKMIVFDKDGTLGDDAASLRRWITHMTASFEMALKSELQFSEKQISQCVPKLHSALGWDAAVRRVIPSAPLAAGTWEESVEACSKVVHDCGLPSGVAREWHSQLTNVHGSDPPVIADLGSMIESCRKLGLLVAVCTSDDRIPTNNSLRNWNISSLIDLSICGDEVPEPKPSARPLEILCQRMSLTPEDCIVVGDTTGDTGMARNAKAGLCIGVLTGSGTADQLMETGADIIVPNVGHIPDLLNCMGIKQTLS